MAAYSLWCALRVVIEGVVRFVIVILISTIQGCVAQISHGKEVHCGRSPNWRTGQEAVD